MNQESLISDMLSPIDEQCSFEKDQNQVFINEQCSFEKELWKLDPLTNFQISSIGRYKSSKINSDIIKTGNSINPKKSIHYQLDFLVAKLFLNYNPELHFLEIIDKDAEYKNSVNNIQLIDRTLPDEIWLQVPDYPNYYCSNMGRVYSHTKKHARLLRPDVGEVGYHRVTIKNKNGKLVRFLVHRLVIFCFKNQENFDELVVNHIDGCKSNNKLENLEAITYSSNLAHAVEMQLNQLHANRRGKIVTAEDINWKSDISFSLPNGTRRTINASAFKM